MPIEGLKVFPSAFGHTETVDRLKFELTKRGMTLFAEIDHAAGAADAGLKLRPTDLLVFGNAKAGTPLMQADQSVGIDLPLKALVHEDPSGQVWLSMNDPVWIAKRHGLEAERAEAMGKALDAIAARISASN